MIVYGKMTHKTWMLASVRRFPSNILRDRFSVYVVPHIETCLDCFQGKRLSVHSAHSSLHVCFFLVPHIVQTIFPVP